jgi:hypothetical protein
MIEQLSYEDASMVRGLSELHPALGPWSARLLFQGVRTIQIQTVDNDRYIWMVISFDERACAALSEPVLGIPTWPPEG